MKLVVVLLAVALFGASTVSAVSLGKIYGLPFKCQSEGDFPMPGFICTPYYYSCYNIDGKLSEFISACYAGGHPVFDPEASKCIAIKQSSCYGVPLHNEVD